MSETYILTENLSKTFETAAGKIEAVREVNLEIRRGEFVSIVGPTGSGKSTLLNLIGAMTRPSEGMVFMDDCYLGGLADRELSSFRGRKIGFIFQFASLIPSLTVVENVSLPAWIIGMKSKETTAVKAQELLDLVGLSDKTRSFSAELSGGEQRRVAIARAFINDPGLILADEPTADLDEQTEVEIFDLLHQYNREKKITFVLVTHNSVLAGKGDHLYFMKNGNLERPVLKRTLRKDIRI